jgi:cyclase
LKRFHKISDQPVRVLIDTNHRLEHTGSNGRFLADGTQILAHANVGRNLAKLGPVDAAIGAPTKTYDDHMNLKLGGIEVHVMHFGNACTDGDSVVYFPDLKVVAVGDLYAAAPIPDYASGGSLVGWASVLDQILKLDFDVVVPGSGATVSKADLAAFKTKIDALVVRATRLVSDGVPEARLMAGLETDDFGWRLNFTGAQLDGFYDEIARKR